MRSRRCGRWRRARWARASESENTSKRGALLSKYIGPTLSAADARTALFFVGWVHIPCTSPHSSRPPSPRLPPLQPAISCQTVYGSSPPSSSSSSAAGAAASGRFERRILDCENLNGKAVRAEAAAVTIGHDSRSFCRRRSCSARRRSAKAALEDGSMSVVPASNAASALVSSAAEKVTCGPDGPASPAATCSACGSASCCFPGPSTRSARGTECYSCQHDPWR